MDISDKNPYGNGLLYAGFNQVRKEETSKLFWSLYLAQLLYSHIAQLFQDQTCFCVGTETGFRIYNSDPLRCQESQERGPGGGVRCAEMLFR